jgi:CRP-like cAMP-binding protein
MWVERKATMFIHEADLFKGMNQDVIREIDEVTVKESHDKGDSVFRAGDPADNFYILAGGIVKLTIGEQGYMAHVVSNPGEAFGWSSLVESSHYSASAECSVPTTLLRIEKEELSKIFERHPPSGVAFFKRLAGVVGRRLINSYHSLLISHSVGGHTTSGISEDFETEEQAEVQ